jgi:hypothetical protein
LPDDGIAIAYGLGSLLCPVPEATGPIILNYNPWGHNKVLGGVLRVFITKVFARFVRKERLDDRQLCEAIARAERGLVDADLGGNLIKQRVARPGRGRSGGYRTVVAYRASQRSVFLYGFAKSERDNIDVRELDDLKLIFNTSHGKTAQKPA